MRVIGGTARGRRLLAPAKPSVRPTSDRVREAIFDVLGSLGGVEGAVVLDCFAGSGALGIEALSRGAASVTFVDRDADALAAVRANLAAAGFGGDLSTRLVRADALAFVSDPAVGRYDLALLDPPYRFERWAPLLERLRAETAVLESSSPVELVPPWHLYRAYRYGGTLVTVATEAASPAKASRERRSGAGAQPGAGGR